jgi:hypothetical protein
VAQALVNVCNYDTTVTDIIMAQPANLSDRAMALPLVVTQPSRLLPVQGLNFQF